MDGDLFGSNKTGGYSDGPSLLDFASPPPSQGNNFDLPQQEPQATENLLDFGAPPSQETSAAPLIDLFGGEYSTPNTTPLPQSQPQPLDLFGSPIPEATPSPAPVLAAVDAFAPVATPSPAPTHAAADAFAPVPSPAPVVADDPFAVFSQPQPQPQVATISDPFSALSIPAQPEAQTTKPDTEPNLLVDTIQPSTTTMAPTISKTPPKTTTIPIVVEEEKKDQESPAVAPAKEQEETASAGSTNSAPVNMADKKEEETPDDKIVEKESKVSNGSSELNPLSIPTDQPAKAKEEGEASISNGDKISDECIEKEPTEAAVSTNHSRPETPNAEQSSPEPKTDVDAQQESKLDELDLMEDTSDAPVSAPAVINKKVGLVPTENNDSSNPKKQQPLVNSSKVLPTLAKPPKPVEKKAPVVANRFAGFQRMAGNIAAKGAERVAKVKDQIKEEGDGQNNRFAGFKNMAGNMAAKGAERVAKVKDQIQKDDSDGQSKRFSGLGFKNMAETMSAKASERVANIKDQMQKDDSDGQSKRFSGLGFKNMAETMSAKASERVANIKDQMQKSNHGMQRSNHGIQRSSHGQKTGGIAQASPVTLSAVVPKSPQQKKSTSVANPSVTPSKSPSKPETPSTAVAPKETVVTSVKINEVDKAAEKSEADSNVESQRPESDEKSSPSSQPQHASPTSQPNSSTENDSSTNTVIESQKVPQNVEVSPNGTEAIENAVKQESFDKTKESTTVPPKNTTIPISDEESHKATAETKETDKNFQPSDDNNISDPVVSTSDSKPLVVESTGSQPPAETQNSTTITSPTENTETKSVRKSSETKEQSRQSPEMLDKLENLQKELHAAHTLIQQLQHRDEAEKPGDEVMMELQANLQKEMTRRAEAEDKARVAIAKSKLIEEEYTTFKTESTSNLAEMTSIVESLTKDNDAMEKELVDIREERDEQARKEMALTTRLNDAKKKEAVKANAAEHYGDQVEQLELAVKEYESEVESLTAERDQLKVELGEWKDYAEKRTKQLEMALNNEKKLSDERKRKMKEFVEAKTEEVRGAKSDYMSLQTELDQTSHSLTELNQRYKQLHAQWVQSQTRNRELQRDAMKMKKDSEKMHKVGGSLEARLSRSAQQSEDHKNKRIEARNELMSVLGKLETEKSVNARLQEAIKMTFTPKALSQQQNIQEALDDFEDALYKLSLRIGRPLPPTFSTDPKASAEDGVPSSELNEGDIDETADANDSGKATVSEINSNKAVQKLENETQRVSQNIAKFSANIERMHSLLDGGGTKSCVDVFSQILSGGNGTPGIAGSTPTRKSIGGQRYG